MQTYSLKNVNKKLFPFGVELVKRRSHYAFAPLPGATETPLPAPVMVSTLETLPLSMWIDLARASRGKMTACNPHRLAANMITDSRSKAKEGTKAMPDNTENSKSSPEEVAAAKAAKAEAAAAAKAERAAKAAAKAEAAAAAKAEAKRAREAKAAAKAAKAEAAAAAKAARIRQNGVLMPKPESKCGAAWAIFDEISAATGKPATIAAAAEMAEARRLNPGNVRAEYGNWRKFHGVPAQGRAKKPEPAAVPADTTAPAE